MKTLNIKKWRVTLLSAVVTVGLMACTTDAVEYNGGKLPDKDPLENTYGMLRSVRAPKNEVRVLITKGATGDVIDNICYQISKATPEALTFDLRIDETLLETYNKANGTSLTLLPVANYKIDGKPTLSIAQNKQKSEIKYLSLNAKDLNGGEYLLPVTVAKSDEELQNQWQTVYYRITIREPQLSDKELNSDQVFMVGYIDVSIYQPLLATDYYVYKTDQQTTWEQVWFRSVGNLINLQKMTLDYDASTKRALLNPGSDIRYVLDHATEYIRPLQDQGRKVCLSIEGAGKGVGFCNLTDMQIADFTSQVKAIVEIYGVDGINLWDRNSGYGKEGMPAMNTTSYPKLIKALREALGAGKLLTVTDHLAPTEYFWDPVATGGIKVGDYLDYAWSGYRDNSIMPQIVDPWHPDAVDENGVKLVYEGTHKPFAGLAPSKYGCINVPWYTMPLDRVGIAKWKLAGNKQSNILVYELRTLLQDQFEGSWATNVKESYEGFADDGVIGFVEYDWMPGFLFEVLGNTYELASDRLGNPVPPNRNQYNKWLKNW